MANAESLTVDGVLATIVDNTRTFYIGGQWIEPESRRRPSM